MSAGEVKSFYEGFSTRFVEDYVRGNERVRRQLDFFERAIPADARRILVLGCGSGEASQRVAARRPRAEVLAVDLSESAVALGRRLFPRPNLRYRALDVTREAPDGAWDAVLLPDVYEHIPRGDRAALHRSLAQRLSPRGRVVITVPTPGAQQLERATGGAEQIVEEAVGVSDLQRLAGDVAGELVYFALVSVWRSNDYAHAVIERGAREVRPLHGAPRDPLKQAPTPSPLRRATRGFARRTGMLGLVRALRRLRVRAALRD